MRIANSEVRMPNEHLHQGSLISEFVICQLPRPRLRQTLTVNASGFAALVRWIAKSSGTVGGPALLQVPKLAPTSGALRAWLPQHIGIW